MRDILPVVPLRMTLRLSSGFGEFLVWSLHQLSTSGVNTHWQSLPGPIASLQSGAVVSLTLHVLAGVLGRPPFLHQLPGGSQIQFVQEGQDSA